MSLDPSDYFRPLQHERSQLISDARTRVVDAIVDLLRGTAATQA